MKSVVYYPMTNRASIINKAVSDTFVGVHVDGPVINGSFPSNFEEIFPDLTKLQIHEQDYSELTEVKFVMGVNETKYYRYETYGTWSVPLDRIGNVLPVHFPVLATLEVFYSDNMPLQDGYKPDAWMTLSLAGLVGTVIPTYYSGRYTANGAYGGYVMRGVHRVLGHIVSNLVPNVNVQLIGGWSSSYAWGITATVRVESWVAGGKVDLKWNLEEAPDCGGR